jgi:hypothetical protein
MERRMAALFLLALALIAWQALRTSPVLPPDFEIVTKEGEQLGPMAVPSWHTLPELPRQLPQRLALLEQRALSWPIGKAESQSSDCQAFVRISAHHWAVRPASPALAQRWLGHRTSPAPGSTPSWRLLHFPTAAFLDDDDLDGDPLDDGELRAAGPGAEVEVFCGEVLRVPRELAPGELP